MNTQHPTDRELAALKVIWARGEATVREIYEAMREELPIVQNTVQTLLRTMVEKKLVTFRKEGRTFIYRATTEPAVTERRLLGRVLQSVYDGAVDRLVEGLVSLKRPSHEELTRLRELLDELEEKEAEDREQQP